MFGGRPPSALPRRRVPSHQRALCSTRQARFALRLLARPKDSGGQEEILERKSSLTARIKERCGLGRRETAEVQVWEGFKVLEGRAFVERKEDALRTARELQDQSRTVWTDGSRLEGGAVGAAIAFRGREGWVKRETCLGKNKEVFDAEVFAILRATRLLDDRAESGQSVTISSDSQAAISRDQHDLCGPAQALARAVIATVNNLTMQSNTLDVRWTPAHEGVEGNEQAGVAAESAAEGEERGRSQPICGRLASRTSPEKPRRRGQRPPASGYKPA